MVPAIPVITSTAIVTGSMISLRETLFELAYTANVIVFARNIAQTTPVTASIGVQFQFSGVRRIISPAFPIDLIAE
jgi:hypothetical protein